MGGPGYLMSKKASECLIRVIISSIYNKKKSNLEFQRVLDQDIFVLEDVFLTGIVAQKCSEEISRIHSEKFLVLKQNFVNKEFDPEKHILVHLSNPEEKMKTFWKSTQKFVETQNKLKGI